VRLELLGERRHILAQEHHEAGGQRSDNNSEVEPLGDRVGRVDHGYPDHNLCGRTEGLLLPVLNKVDVALREGLGREVEGVREGRR
jgi:hypothetical protein